MPKIVMLALGTRGDVQPLAVLAWQLQHGEGNTVKSASVVFITHAAHEEWLLDLLGQAVITSGTGNTGTHLQLLFVASNPASVWQQGSSSTYHQPPVTDQHATRQQLLQHSCSALQCGWLLQHFTEQQQQQKQQQQPCSPAAAAGTAPSFKDGQDPMLQLQQQQQQQQQRLIIFNLFALEGYHIAEALQLPCLIAQPYLIPYSMPSGFQKRFSRALPHLTQVLQQQQQQQQQQREVATAYGSQQLPVSWADVSHWMWPLFTERWGPWRQEALLLQQLPLLAAWQEAWQGCTFRSSSSSADTCTAHDHQQQQQQQQQQTTPDQSQEDGGTTAAAAAEVHCGPPAAQLPASVPVLYGLSPSVVLRPGYWPGSVQLTGFWLAADMHAQPAWQQQQQGCSLPAPLQQFLTTSSAHSQQQQTTRAADALDRSSEGGGCGGVLLVDFGSMGCLGLLREAQLLLDVLLRALQLLNWRGVLLTGGWQPLADAYAAVVAGSGQSLPLFLQHQPLACHHLLLSAADAVLHHGGSGTAAAALAAGTPQLICPLQFDQFYWAERIAHLNCSPAALSVAQLLPGDAVSALKQPYAGPAQQQQEAIEMAPGVACRLQQPPPQAAEVAAHGAAPGDGSGQDPAAAAAVGAAAAYLASRVRAARQADVLQACSSMKEAIAQERGLQQAATSVLRYCQCLAECGQQQQPPRPASSAEETQA